MRRFLISAAACVVLTGCVGVIGSQGKLEHVSGASNAEMVEIAAACLRYRYSSLKRPPSDYVIYLSVQNADWRAVLERTGIPFLRAFIFGHRDHFWSDDGYHDTATGLRAYMFSISIDGTLAPKAEKADVYFGVGVGTNLAGSGDIYQLEKKSGQWQVVKVVNRWTA